MSENSGEFLKGLLIGGVAGVLFGVLYAPKSGKETREDIGRKTDELLCKAKEDYEKALERSKKTYETALGRLRDLESTAKETVGNLEGEVEGMAERGVEAIVEGKNRFKRAIDAGVDAFKEEKSA